MKVLWVEDHARAGELLAAAAAAASRKRYGIDLVIAMSLMDAERKLRLERFDLVVIDLMLPDSTDEDATVTRIASMGKFRVAVVSGSDKRNEVVREPRACGRRLRAQGRRQGRPAAGEFVRRPELFRDFLHVADAAARRPAAQQADALPTSARICREALRRRRGRTCE